jgi:NAD(P)H-flavin reductase
LKIDHHQTTFINNAKKMNRISTLSTTHFSPLQLASHGASALVFVCGPQSLVQDCAQLTMEHGVDFRSEGFQL